MRHPEDLRRPRLSLVEELASSLSSKAVITAASLGQFYLYHSQMLDSLQQYTEVLSMPLPANRVEYSPIVAVQDATIPDFPESGYHITRRVDPTALSAEDGAYQAHNPLQRLSAYFSEEGVRVRPGRYGPAPWK